MSTLILLSMGVGRFRNRPKKKTKIEVIIKNNEYELIIYNKKWMHSLKKECNHDWELMEHIQYAQRFLVPYPRLDEVMMGGVNYDYDPTKDPKIRI